MQRRTPIFIVTSSRPRIGKTLIARALTEYFCAQNRPVGAFDVNPDEFKLIDHLPAYTAAASLNDTRGEMALFDQLVLEDTVPKVVDLNHQLLDRFFSVALPLAAPGVAAAAIIGFAACLGEFGAVITFAANIPGQTQTLPLAIYAALQAPGGDALALRLTLISFAIAMIALFASEALARRAQRLAGR